MSVCLSVRLSVCVSVCLSVCHQTVSNRYCSYSFYLILTKLGTRDLCRYAEILILKFWANFFFNFTFGLHSLSAEIALLLLLQRLLRNRNVFVSVISTAMR